VGAKTTTFVSTVPIDVWSCPGLTACSKWRKILSISFFLHAWHQAYNIQTIDTEYFSKMCSDDLLGYQRLLLVGKRISRFYFHQYARNLANSLELEASTHHLIPFPILSRTSAFKLSGLYTSQAISSLETC